MFIFRGISNKDASLEFITGNKAFDEKSPNENLKPFNKLRLIKRALFLKDSFLFDRTQSEIKIRAKRVN
ncbi:MAG: hypothetical protein EU548_08100 [Promethearchaeota archaeon]|nr:MAG: hypothetical protein EU548_08100 [Candidatus Lokiarchaeota archaeon]